MKNKVWAMALKKILDAKATEYDTYATNAVSKNREEYIKKMTMSKTFDLIAHIVDRLKKMPPDDMIKTAEKMALSAHFGRLGGTFRLGLTPEKGNTYIFRGKEYGTLPFKEVKTALKEEGIYEI